MTAYTNKKHVVRAALESIAYQIRDVLEIMREDTGFTPQSIYSDGGPTANRFLMQFTADMLGLELKVADIPNVSPLGAALSGALGMGVYSSFDELTTLPRKYTSYRPSMNDSEVNRYYEGWKRAVAQVLYVP